MICGAQISEPLEELLDLTELEHDLVANPNIFRPITVPYRFLVRILEASTVSLLAKVAGRGLWTRFSS